MKTCLIVDASALCYRSFYALPDLSHDGVKTAVVYGVLRQVRDLEERFVTSRTAWCFDSGRSLRREVVPSYKRKRREDLTEEQERARQELFGQIKLLRTDYLPSLGYRNVFVQNGYEADDVIASVVQHLPRQVGAVVVSDDGDLYQLLEGERIVMWRPAVKRVYGEQQLREEYGAGPGMWASVKALAGCPGDGVEGVKGVGIKTAVRFLSGTLKDTSVVFRRIVEGNGTWRANLRLVELPFHGACEFRTEPDAVAQDKWDQLTKRLGIKSLGRQK